MGSWFTNCLITSGNGIQTRWGVPVKSQREDLLYGQEDKMSAYGGIMLKFDPGGLGIRTVPTPRPVGSNCP